MLGVAVQDPDARMQEHQRSECGENVDEVGETKTLATLANRCVVLDISVLEF